MDAQRALLDELMGAGGTALNIIPPSVEVGGTLRSVTTDGLNWLQQRLKEEEEYRENCCIHSSAKL
ncbi:IAA-amino acid hydrolase ILR1-like 3 [Bienertia sinuspersici]